MASPESSHNDDHTGRRDDIIEVFGDEMLGTPGYIKMSSGSVIHERDLRRYQDLYESEETLEEHRFVEKAVAFGGAATLTFAVIALAHRRLKKD